MRGQDRMTDLKSGVHRKDHDKRMMYVSMEG